MTSAICEVYPGWTCSVTRQNCVSHGGAAEIIYADAAARQASAAGAGSLRAQAIPVFEQAQAIPE